MESADPRLILLGELFALAWIQAWRIAVRPVAITPCHTLRNLSAATSCLGSCFRQPELLGRLADEVRLVHPVVGQQGPDGARRLVG